MPTNVYPQVDVEITIPRNFALLPIMRYFYSRVFDDANAADGLQFLYKGIQINETDSADSLGLGFFF